MCLQFYVQIVKWQIYKKKSDLKSYSVQNILFVCLGFYVDFYTFYIYLGSWYKLIMRGESEKGLSASLLIYT